MMMMIIIVLANKDEVGQFVKTLDARTHISRRRQTDGCVHCMYSYIDTAAMSNFIHGSHDIRSINN